LGCAGAFSISFLPPLPRRRWKKKKLGAHKPQKENFKNFRRVLKTENVERLNKETASPGPNQTLENADGWGGAIGISAAKTAPLFPLAENLAGRIRPPRIEVDLRTNWTVFSPSVSLNRGRALSFSVAALRKQLPIRNESLIITRIEEQLAAQVRKSRRAPVRKKKESRTSFFFFFFFFFSLVPPPPFFRFFFFFVFFFD